MSSDDLDDLGLHECTSACGSPYNSPCDSSESMCECICPDCANDCANDSDANDGENKGTDNGNLKNVLSAVPSTVLLSANYVMNLEHLKPELVCGVCYEIMIRPSSLTCGHMFCVVCLETYSKQGGFTCPMCRAPIHKKARFNSNKLVDELMRGIFHDDMDYRSRLNEKTQLEFHMKLTTFYKQSPRYNLLQETLYQLLEESLGFMKFAQLSKTLKEIVQERGILAQNTSQTLEPDTDSSDEATLSEIQFLVSDNILGDPVNNDNETVIAIDEWIVDLNYLENFLELYGQKISETGTLVSMCQLASLQRIITNEGYDSLNIAYKKYKHYIPAYLKCEVPLLDLPCVRKVLAQLYKREILKLSSELGIPYAYCNDLRSETTDAESAPNSDPKPDPNPDKKPGLNTTQQKPSEIFIVVNSTNPALPVSNVGSSA